MENINIIPRMENQTPNIITEKIKTLYKIFENGKLTQTIVNKWLNELPKEEQDDAKYALESALFEEVKNLPE